MKMLIIGGDGMLGHQLFLHLRDQYEVKVTLRKELGAYRSYRLFDQHNSYAGVDVRQTNQLLSVISDFKPHAVINAAGIVKQRKDAKEIIPSLEINALFPHRLALICKLVQARLIHISTDCVFSGKKGKYTENDSADAEDIYGKTKYLGEVHEPHCVTLRSSIIGLELSRKTSLIEWFLAQTGNIKGFTQAIYSGLTTLEMSRLIERILMYYPDLCGLWHVASSEPINKYELLSTFTRLLERRDIQIEPDVEFFCDRSLVADKIQQAIHYIPPSWLSMLEELATQVKMRESKYVISK